MREQIETVIVGGGQAGLGLSYHLAQRGREHLVLEQGAQPGEAWRNHRWDSFTLVTPNWSFQVPGAEYDGDDPHGYLPRDAIVGRFERLVAQHRLPVQFNTRVESIRPDPAGAGYRVSTPGAELRARNVVIATGFFQHGKIPAYAADIPTAVYQLHSDQYRNPHLLPPGNVLVVGGGQSGGQIAEELHESGREVYFSASPGPCVPRSYRGRDFFYWALECGYLSRTAAQLPSPAARLVPNPLITGRRGGYALNAHTLYQSGVRLVGRAVGYADGKMHFAADLKETLDRSADMGRSFIALVDRYIAQNGLDAPREELLDWRAAYAAPEVTGLDLRAAGVSTVLWATGYRPDFSLLSLPVVDEYGFPITERGVTRFPGLYFLGMPWIYQQKSGILAGVGQDAAYLAEQIA